MGYNNMILLIDNYDSFTYNLYQLFGKYDENINVIRNDKLTVGDVEDLGPDYIIISPGPGNPVNKNDFGVCSEIIKEFKNVPILGVCLGHQGIFYTYGGKIKKSTPVHGKKDKIKHYESEIFKNVPEEFDVIRYHSLIADKDNIPKDIKVTAENKDGIIMAIEHRKYPTFGIQFHPESIGGHYSDIIVKNFLNL